MTRTLEILEKLVAFPTVSHTSNLEMVGWVEDLLHKAGFTVTRIPAVTQEKSGLFAQKGPDAPGGVCLSGHMDVVPVEGQIWNRPAFQVTKDATRIFGRGTTDMKGFVASALALAERADTADLQKPLSLCLSYDEEVGCVGIRHMMPTVKTLIGQPKVVVVGEPTSMHTAIGHKGKAALHVTCRGQAGHSALAPRFVNAIHLAADFVTEIRMLQTRLANEILDNAYDIPYSTVHVGKISGGQALNMIPDEVMLEMEFRHLAQAIPDKIRAQIRDAGHRIGQKYDLPDAILIEQTNAYPGLGIDADNPAVGWAAKMTENPSTTKVAFGTEAGFFAELGLNAVVVGPGDMSADGHKPDEGIAVSQLVACDQMMTRILQDLC
ncbi:MAG: acetylornithine deacetylase [Roseobacter sp.]